MAVNEAVNEANHRRHHGAAAASGSGPSKKATGGEGPAGSNASGATAHATVLERRSRQVVLHDLPAGTQEGLLQQELEKVVPVKRVEVFKAVNEALVELESPNVSFQCDGSGLFVGVGSRNIINRASTDDHLRTRDCSS